MTIHSTVSNPNNTPNNQTKEVTAMQTTQVNSSIRVPNTHGARQLSSIALWNQQFQLADEMVDRAMRFNGIKPIATVIEGETGAGKTHFAIKKMQKLNAAAVDKGDHTTKPAIMISAPKQSSVPPLVHRLLFELGDIKPNFGTMEDKEQRLKNWLSKLEVKLIIIDEIHDFLPLTNRGKGSKALSWLKGLMDDTCIPILFMGTERASLLSVIDRELASRIRYSVTISQLPYGPMDIDKFDFGEMATAFAENLPRSLKTFNFVSFVEDNVIFSNPNMLDRLYVATKGLPRGLRDMFLEINIEMEDNPKFSPNLESLTSIYARLSSMNDLIDFNPFDDNRLDDVRDYIGYAKKGDANEAA